MTEDAVHICGECGKIESGPEKGLHVPNWDKERGHSRDEPQTGPYATHKGQPISHSICDDCHKKATQTLRQKHAPTPTAPQAARARRLMRHTKYNRRR